jgi:sugar phosphate isomerase/epimerase
MRIPREHHMNRRTFLVGTATGAAAVALGGAALGQGRAATAPPQGGGRVGGGGRGPGSPANVPAAKLARVSIMTLDFGSLLKFPWTQNPSENQTLDLLDLPQMYQDVYGVTHIEFQHGHLVNGGQTPPDAAFFREVRAKLDAAKVTATQVNIEIGTIPNLADEARAKWMTLGKQWVDAAPIIGVKRLMLNQTGLNDENKANCISVWKEIQDYAKPKGIKISAETRGTGGGRRGGQPGEQPAAPAAPSDPRAAARSAYLLLAQVIEAAGAYSNVDIGNVGAPDQQTLHDAIKALYSTSSGNMHIKSSPNWDIGAAVRFAESLGYRGHYSIEVNGHPAVRQVYAIILANVTNPLTE